MHAHRMRWRLRHGAGHAYQLAGGGTDPGEHHDPFEWLGGFASRMERGDLGGGAFGVRRPLRYLAHKLELDEDQAAELATVIDELKIDRAQAEVDGRRAVAAFADAVAGDAFDQERVAEGGATRVRSAEHLREAVERALRRIHALLRPEQRRRFAYLIRTGALRI